MMWKAGVLQLPFYVTPPPRPEAVSETNMLPTTVNTTTLLPQATQARLSNTRVHHVHLAASRTLASSVHSSGSRCFRCFRVHWSRLGNQVTPPKVTATSVHPMVCTTKVHSVHLYSTPDLSLITWLGPGPLVSDQVTQSQCQQTQDEGPLCRPCNIWPCLLDSFRSRSLKVHGSLLQ